MLNAKLERHMTGPHALSREVSTYIYIYIYRLVSCPCDAHNFVIFYVKWF